MIRRIRPANFGFPERESKKLGLIGFAYLAFLLIDLELEFAFQILANTSYDTFSRAFAFDQNDESSA